MAPILKAKARWLAIPARARKLTLADLAFDADDWWTGYPAESEEYPGEAKERRAAYLALIALARAVRKPKRRARRPA